MLLLPLMCFLSGTAAAPAAQQINLGVEWLSRFGYLPPPDPVTGQLQTKEALSKAIKTMQRFGGLEQTGVLDEETLVLMKTPRCSLPDLSEVESTTSRRRRALPSQGKWNKRHLSWRIRTFPRESPFLGRDTVRALMYYALKVWSDIAPLDFHEVAGSEADIQIDFTKSEHNDGYPFDGPGGTVAHAFFPGDSTTAGDVHFDDDESWTFRSPDAHGMDLFAVAVHEFGHAIGLAHTSAADSIMWPYYQGPVGDPLKYHLSYQDKIHRFWRGLPDNLAGVDAVYERPGDHKIVFFKGLWYWVFKDNNVEEGYPRPISDFGLPTEGVDAAFVWPHNDKTYFFKDGHYWRYDDYLRRMDQGYPKDSSLWKDVPTQLDDAMRWSDGATYFFRGMEYWRVLGSSMEVEAGFPRTIGKDWLLCADVQSDSPLAETNGTEVHLQGQHGAAHTENSYEVCSCTSDSATSLWPHPDPPLRLLACLWTIAASLSAPP